MEHTIRKQRHMIQPMCAMFFLIVQGGNESYVYYVKMWDGDTLVGDLVPCVRQSDNATGFFNKVDNTFHTNTSGPAIVHGPLTGESYEFVAPTSINAKLGTGLSFDSNDAIELDNAIRIKLNCNNEPD